MRLANYTAACADAVWFAQAAGVNYTIWLIGRLASPGRTESRNPEAHGSQDGIQPSAAEVFDRWPLATSAASAKARIDGAC
jgi:hypothetical protein